MGGDYMVPIPPFLGEPGFTPVIKIFPQNPLQFDQLLPYTLED